MSSSEMRSVDRNFGDLLRAEAQGTRRSGLIVGAVVLIVLLSMLDTGLLDAQRLGEGLPAMWQLAGEMVPPDFSRVGDYVRPLIDTVAMSIAGTALAVAFSLPLAFLAANNTTPNRAIYHAARGLLNVLRSVPELIMGIVFVAAVGFGTLPGVLALGLHSVGMVGKFFAEAIEHVDPKPIEAARAAGATGLQVIHRAILPQVMPQMSDVTVYRWEYNFRASTVMGMVGAGGIGFELMSSLRIMNYQEVFAILLCILACVTLVDALGAVLRGRLK